MFKKIIVGLLSLVILAVISLTLLIIFIPKDKVLEQVIAQVNASDGIELDIKGKTDLHLFPNITIDIEHASIKSTKNVVASVDFDKLELSLGFMAALSGNYNIDKIILTKPIATIDITGLMKANTNHGKMLIASNAQTIPQMQVAENNLEILKQITLEKLVIKDGDIRIIDKKQGLNERFKDLDLEVNLPSLSRAMKLDADFDYLAKKHKIDLSVNSLQALLFEGKNADTSLNFETKDTEMSFDGTLKMINDVINYNGQTSLEVADLKALLETYKKFTGGGKDAAVKKISYRGQVIGNDKNVDLKISKLTADLISMTGDLAINLARKLPFVKGNLNFASLDLTAMNESYGVKDAVMMLASNSKQIPQHAAVKGGNKVIDVSAIKKLNADLNINVSQLKLDDLLINNLTSHTKINNGVMNATYNIPSLFQGLIKGDVMVNAKGTTPAFGLNMIGDKLEAGDLMTHLADRPYLSGKLSLKNNLKARGNTINQMIRTLSGSGQATLPLGSLNGIDLSDSVAELTKDIQSKSLNTAKKTALRDTLAQYTIQNGLMNVNKLQMISDFASIYGSGQVNLVQEKLNLYMKPKLAREEKTLLDSVMGAPFYVKGTFSNLKIVPDIAALAPKLLERGITKTPENVLDLSKELIKKPKDVLNLFR